MYDRITVKKELCMHDLDDFLWSGAKDRWDGADEYTKGRVWNRICDWAECAEEVNDTWVNDTIWFECDDLFYPDDEESEDEDEESEDEDEESEDEDEESDEGEESEYETTVI